MDISKKESGLPIEIIDMIQEYAKGQKVEDADSDDLTPEGEGDAEKAPSTVPSYRLREKTQQISGLQATIAQQTADMAAMKGKLDEYSRKQAKTDGNWDIVIQSKDAEIAAAKAELKHERLNTVRLTVGIEQGIPSTIALMITGDTPDEIRAQAALIKQQISAMISPGSSDLDARQSSINNRKKPAPASSSAGAVNYHIV